MVLRRFFSSVVLVPLVAAAAYAGGTVYRGLVLVTMALAAYEFDGLMRTGGYRVGRLSGLALLLVLLADAIAPGNQIMQNGLPLLVMATLAYAVTAGDPAGALVTWALTLAGALYIGLLAQAIRLRELEAGLPLTALAAFTTWANDTVAYVIGTRFGRHRLSPRISPHKSWEGAVGGALAGGLVGVCWGYFTLPQVAGYHVFILTALVVVAGIAGDLAESLLKRQVGAKDAGSLIPGHGGVLDRSDSLMFALAAAAIYAEWVLNLKN